MPRRADRPGLSTVGIPEDPDHLAHHLHRYLSFLEERNYSSYTVDNWRRSASDFIGWCDLRGVQRLEELTRPVLEGYQRHLFHYRKPDGEPLAVGSQHTKLIALQQWFKWLVRRGLLTYNPTADMELPKRGVRLPRAILSARESEAVLAVPDIQTLLGLRDKAILETLYSTGMRRMELMKLKIKDLDFEGGAVMVREGKGKRDRLIPIGERALLWVQAYLERVRPALVVEPDQGVLFLTSQGNGFKPMGLSRLTSGYIKESGIGKPGSCHLFRHTMATLMLDGGADIRHVQSILGHVRLDTTMVYTHVSIAKLKEVHTATHPGKLAQVGQHAEEPEGAPTREPQQ